MGDAYSTHTTHAFHTKFQHYNITHKATLASLSHTINNTTKEISHQLNGLLIYVTICTYVSLNTKESMSDMSIKDINHKDCEKFAIKRTILKLRVGEMLVTKLATWYGCGLSARPPIVNELKRKLAII